MRIEPLLKLLKTKLSCECEECEYSPNQKQSLNCAEYDLPGITLKYPEASLIAIRKKLRELLADE